MDSDHRILLNTKGKTSSVAFLTLFLNLPPK
jgi:hypothetical protein